YLTVEAGQAAGVHQIGRGLSKDGKELVYLELQMYVGAKEPGDTISLSGHPNVSLVIPGGAHGDIATASVVVNSIPVILDAPACSSASIVFDEFSFVAGEGVVERIDKSIFVDEIAFPFRPGRENFLLLHVVQRLVIVDGLLHDR